MTPDLSALITSAYRQFADYRVQYPLAICQCGSCMTPDEQRDFLSIPLRSLPAGWLQLYLTSVPSEDDAAYIQEVKHFLPRILELLAQGNELSNLIETTLSKLMLNKNDLWPCDEHALMQAYARAFIPHLFAEEPWNRAKDDGNILRGNTANYLLMFHWAGLRITDELAAIWRGHAYNLLALDDFVALFDAMDWQEGAIQWKKAFYLPDYCPQREEFIATMNTWFNHPDTRRAFHAALEVALLNGDEPPEESLQWHSVYDWLED